jgi:hypothetical protein
MLRGFRRTRGVDSLEPGSGHRASRQHGLLRWCGLPQPVAGEKPVMSREMQGCLRHWTPGWGSNEFPRRAHLDSPRPTAVNFVVGLLPGESWTGFPQQLIVFPIFVMQQFLASVLNCLLSFTELGSLVFWTDVTFYFFLCSDVLILNREKNGGWSIGLVEKKVQ